MLTPLPRSPVWLALLSCFCGFPAGAVPDEAAPSAPTLDPAAEGLVMQQVESAYPGAWLMGARAVFDANGSRIGTLLTWRIGEDEPDTSPALFSGASALSVLVDARVTHPLWAMSTSGAPVGIPDDVALVWLEEDSRWAWLENDALIDAERGTVLKTGTRLEPTQASSTSASLERTTDSLERTRARAEVHTRTSPAACTGNYGAVLGSFATQSAYSNGASGSCTGTGSGTYQCVQFTDRVHKVTASHSGNANTYNDGNNPRAMNMVYFKNNNGTYVAMMGDIAVSDGGSYGHVAVFANNCSSGSQTLMDQNWSSSSATHKVSCNGTSVGSMSSSYPVAGWLRPGWDFYSGYDSGTVKGWVLRNTAFVSSDSTGVTLNPGADPYLESPSGLQLNPVPTSKGGQGYGVVKVRMKSKAPDGNVQLFFKTSNENYYDDKKSAKATIKNDGTWQVAQFNMAGNLYQR